MIQVESPKTENPSVCNRKFLSVYDLKQTWAQNFCFTLKLIKKLTILKKNLVSWVGITSKITFNLALWVSTTWHRHFTYIPKSVITFPKWWVKPLLGEVEGKGWNLSFKQHFKVNIWRFASNCQKWLSKNLIFFQILPIQSL